MSAEDRAEILDEAKVYVTKDRNSSYGEPEDNFGAIADIWNAQGVRIDGNPIDPVDVALMMAGMKLARLRHNPTHRDSWTDAIGYLACGWSCAKPFEGANGVKIKADELRGPTEKYAWVSENRCSDIRWLDDWVPPNPHEGHAYGVGNGQWCDGYARVVPEH